MRVLPALFCLAVFSLPPVLIQADAVKPIPLPKLTLAQALAALPPPTDGGLRLTVSAELVTLPDTAAPPPADAEVSEVAAAFGDQLMPFGTVTAVAPSTMTLLNTQPEPPNIAADMNSMTALTTLAASLDDAQWKMLISERGLGLPDLTDDTQRSLFHALFSHGHLWIGSNDPALRSLPEAERTDAKDVTSQIDGVCVRLGQTADIYLHDRKGKILFYSGERPDAATRLHTYHPKLPPVQTEHSVVLKANVPNALKPSDLDYDGSALQASVSVAGLKTVGDLVTRIGQRTGFTLYADPHYAARTLTISGAASAPASDLLRAVCVCVTGTFRKVDIAYVLTDDLVGVGVRRKHLQDWEDTAFMASSKLGRQSSTLMLKRRGGEARHLPTFGDPLAVTPEEMAALPDMPGLRGVPGGAADGNSNLYPFAKLTPAQQEWARQIAASYNEQHHKNSLPDYLDDNDLDDADLTKGVNLGVNYQMQLLVPSQSGPVDTNLNVDLWILFYSGSTPEATADYNALAAKERAKMPPPPPLSAVLHAGRVRAVLGHPRTAKDVDALVASMQKLGLNQLWLDVFSGGVDHLKTSAVSGTDILVEALARTQGTGIEVYTDLSLLYWGDAPPDTTPDLTIDGKTSREAARENYEKYADETVDDDGKPKPYTAAPLRVSPSAPAVRSALTALVTNVGAQPGLAGFIWEDAGADNTLGYTSGMRQAFLQTAHADPLDITPQTYLRADVSLPLFDDDTADKTLSDGWAKAREDAVRVLLGELWSAAFPPGHAPLPVLMEQREPFGDNWIASWDDPRQKPPPLRDLFPSWPFPSRDKLLRLAKAKSRFVVKIESIQNDGETALLARRLADDAKAMPSDGFVLEFTHDDVTQGAAPLASLVQAVGAEKNTKPVEKAVH